MAASKQQKQQLGNELKGLKTVGSPSKTHDAGAISISVLIIEREKIGRTKVGSVSSTKMTRPKHTTFSPGP